MVDLDGSGTRLVVKSDRPPHEPGLTQLGPKTQICYLRCEKMPGREGLGKIDGAHRKVVEA